MFNYDYVFVSPEAMKDIKNWDKNIKEEKMKDEPKSLSDFKSECEFAQQGVNSETPPVPKVVLPPTKPFDWGDVPFAASGCCYRPTPCSG